MGGSHRHLVVVVDDDDDDEDEDEDEEEKGNVYMYPADMNPDEQAGYRATCRAFKANE